jgi:DNA-binding transcriptional ArsR family regulator
MSTRGDKPRAAVATVMPIPPQRLDELYAVLSDSTRRRILRELADSDGSCAFGTLVSTLSDRSAAAAEHTTVESVRLRLHHVHLPKLVAADLVDWDHAVGRIERGEDWDDGLALLYTPAEGVVT